MDFFFTTDKKKENLIRTCGGALRPGIIANVKNLTDSGLECTILVTPGAVPLHLTPGVSDPDQLNDLTSVIHLKSDIKTDFILFFLSLFL